MKAKLHHKHIGIVAALILAVSSLCGCTQQNGHLGALFGSWALIEIVRDGEAMPAGYETVFSFQNEIVRVVGYLDPPYKTSTRYGNFTHEGKALTLKFAPEPTSTDGRMYMAPEWLHFPKDENILHFEVKSLRGTEMELTLAGDETTLCYKFRKTW